MKSMKPIIIWQIDPIVTFQHPQHFPQFLTGEKKHVGKHKESNSQDLVQNLKVYKAKKQIELFQENKWFHNWFAAISWLI